MSRRLRPLLLLLGLIALPALAAEGLAGIDNCPSRKATTEGSSEPAAAERSSTTDAAPATRAAGGEAAGSAPRARPRWQSFLPGMIR